MKLNWQGNKFATFICFSYDDKRFAFWEPRFVQPYFE